ncbi:MAG: DUF4349 domain-containing protein, partial [Sphingobacteriales bacterium]
MKPIAFAAAALLMLTACQRNESPQYKTDEVADSTGYTGAIADTVAGAAPDTKLVKTASLDLQVSDVHAGSRTLAGLAHRLGGALRQQRVSANEQSSRSLNKGQDSLLVLHSLAPSASLSLRIPSDRLE